MSIFTDPHGLLYERMTRIMEHQIGELSDSDRPCSYCARPASQHGGKLWHTVDSYGEEQHLCRVCSSISVTDLDLMGVQRAAGRSGAPIGYRFGDMPGTGVVIEAREGGRAVLLAPSATYAKLPKAFTDRLETVAMTISGHIPYIWREKFRFPLLYIASLGRKKDLLMRGLTISWSASNLIACDDSSAISWRFRRHDLAASEKVFKAADGNKKSINALATLLRGQIAPAQLQQQLAKKEALAELYALLPSDPVLAIQVLNDAARFMEVEEQQGEAK